MKSLLDNVNELDFLIRQHHKIESKMQSGQFLGAHRELCRVMAYLQKAKQDLIADAQQEEQPTQETGQQNEE